MIDIKPSHSGLHQLPGKATHVSQLVYSLNTHHQWGNRLTILDMFVGWVVLVVGDTFQTIPTARNLQGRSFLFPPKPQ